MFPLLILLCIHNYLIELLRHPIVNRAMYLNYKASI